MPTHQQAPPKERAGSRCCSVQGRSHQQHGTAFAIFLEASPPLTGRLHRSVTEHPANTVTEAEPRPGCTPAARSSEGSQRQAGPSHPRAHSNAAPRTSRTTALRSLLPGSFPEALSPWLHPQLDARTPPPHPNLPPGPHVHRATSSVQPPQAGAATPPSTSAPHDPAPGQQSGHAPCQSPGRLCPIPAAASCRAPRPTPHPLTVAFTLSPPRRDRSPGLGAHLPAAPPGGGGQGAGKAGALGDTARGER